MAPQVLSKIFSREKGLWYAYVWNESDRLGFKKYLNHNVQHNLFIREGEKLSVLYNSNETEKIYQKIKNKYLHNKNFVSRIFRDIDREWKNIGPYIEEGKQIKAFAELRSYYIHLVKWWAAMAILFRLDLPEKLAEPALEYRKRAEKFSDTMIEVWDTFFIKKKLQSMMNLFTPKEAFSATKLSSRKMIEIKNRNRGAVLYNSQLYSLGELEKTLKRNRIKIEEIHTDRASKIKGRIAYKGKVIGTVKIVLLSKEISKVKEGNILVAEMTSPDYVPAMRRAIGFITDEGGITSHAAIVAREMKKPCIIGTKIATKVLKDNDLVELDANNGIVQIIKRTR